MAFVKEAFVNKAAYVKRSRKHRYIKPFALLLAAVLLCGLTGCNKNGTSSSESSLGDSQNISADNSIEDFEPVPVPDGGWTAESLAKTIRINGKELPQPFTCESLGDGYEIKSENIGVFLYYNGKYISQVRFKDRSDEVDNSKELDMICIAKEQCEDNSVTINGVRIGSTRAEAERFLGKPTVEFESSGTIVWDYVQEGGDYENGDAFLVLYFNHTDDELSIIGFYFK